MAEVKNIEFTPNTPSPTVDEIIKRNNIDMSLNEDMSKKLQQIKADFDNDIAKLKQTLDEKWDDLENGSLEEIKETVDDVHDYGSNCIDVMNNIESAKVSGLYDDKDIIDDDTRKLMDDAYDEAETGFENANKFQKGLFAALSDRFYTAKLNHDTEKVLEKIENSTEVTNKRTLTKNLAKPFAIMATGFAAAQIIPTVAMMLSAPPLVLGAVSTLGTFAAIQTTVIFAGKALGYSTADHAESNFYNKESQCRKLQEKMNNLSVKYSSGNALLKPLYQMQFKIISTTLGKFLDKAEVLREKAVKSGEKTYKQLVEINNKRNNAGMEENEQLTEVMSTMRKNLDALYDYKETLQKEWRTNRHTTINDAVLNISNETLKEDSSSKNEPIDEDLDEDMDEPSID